MAEDQAFKDRAHAGRLLAERLEQRGLAPDLVLGLPRGGVPVAFAVATRLRVALDIVLVRKLGLPSQPEYAIGAIGSGGVTVIQPAARTLPGLAATLERVAAAEKLELARRERLYRGGHPALQLQGRQVVLVDDGIATGASMLAAIEVVRAGGAARVTVAAPVASPQAVRLLREHADDVVCLRMPPGFRAVGQHYRHFDQCSDEDVQDLLAIAWRTEALQHAAPA